MKRHALGIIVQQFPDVARLPDIRRLKKELLLDILEAVADYMSPSPNTAAELDDDEEDDVISVVQMPNS